MESYSTPGTVTSRKVRHITQRETQFWPVGPSAGSMLTGLDSSVERVYLVGDRPAQGWLPWALERIPAGWEPGQHFLEGAHPVMRYKRPGRSVTLQAAASWFPSGDYSVSEASAAYRTLGAALRGAFPDASLLDTPATTGRELMLQSIPEGVEWPVLSDEHQELIRATSGQARIETVGYGRQLIPGLPDENGGAGDWVETIPALYEYDMRLAYAASAWGLGAGVPVVDEVHEYAGQQRGRYFVGVAVPKDWPHPFGLVGVKEGRDGWRYPCDPTEAFWTWCDGAELHVLLKYGWHVVIAKRLLFPDYSGSGPLDLWKDRLVKLYANLAANPLARQGVRSIILHSIGALAASSHTITRFSKSIDDVPADARAKVRFEGDYCLWPETKPAAWKEMQHPEWAAAIWARTRARLLDGPGVVRGRPIHPAPRTGALHAKGEVVAFSTDALYLTARQDWLDNGLPGRFRLKRWGEGPYPRPANRTDVIRLRNSLPNEAGEA